MKIEFVKQTNVFGSESDSKPFFYTLINGSIVTNSLSYDESEARKLHDRIIELNGKTDPIKEILESTEI